VTPAPKREMTAEALESALAKTELTDLQRELVRIQWLQTLAWMDRRAGKNWAVYTFLRLVAILGAVFVPALVAVNASAEWATTLRIATFTLSLCVAIATALESFLRSGDRWRHYRRNSEALRLEGMQFLMLSGPYNDAASHGDGFHLFATRLNGILGSEVDAYFTKVAVEKQPGEQSESRPKEKQYT
jgi:Protein of unknown function (DUF4231)